MNDARWVRRLLLILALAVWVGCSEPRRPTVPAPNVLLVLADDLGYGDSRAYNPQSKIAMPHLEQLARDGMRFTDFHSPAAVCAPTRYSLATGNYPWRGRYVNGVWKAYGEPQVLPGQTTLAELLKTGGYHTAKVGKHHLGGLFHRREGPGFARRPEEMDYAQPFRAGPRDRGFDFSYIVPCGIQDPPYAFFRDDRLEGDPAALRHWEAGDHGASRIRNPGTGSPDWDSSTVGPQLLDEALTFLNDHHQSNLAAGTSVPFFLYYSAIEAHWPWTPAESLRGQPVRGVTGLGARADLVYQFDLALGELLGALERLGLADSTLVIVTSDNGGDPAPAELSGGHSTAGELLGTKGEISEGGHRIPLVARWGNGSASGSRIAPGAVSSQLLSLQDLSATLAELTGVQYGAEQAVDSFSFLPVLLGGGDGTAPVRDHLVVQDGRGPNFALREGEWKLLLDRDGKAGELLRVDAAGGEASARQTLSVAAYAHRQKVMERRFAELQAAPRTAPPLRDIDRP